MIKKKRRKASLISAFRKLISCSVSVKKIKRHSDGTTVYIKGRHGKGVTSVVYNGKFNGRPVVVKRIPLSETRTQRIFNYIANVNKPCAPNRNAIRGEVYRLSLCEHNNVVEYIDAFASRHSVWIVTEACFGSLWYLCIRPKNIFSQFSSPIEVINFVFAPICDAVAFIHSKGFVHLDLKPGNVLLSEHLKPKIIDFGFSLKADCRYYHTRDEPFGTTGYMAPEMVRSRKFSYKADVWSLASLYSRMIWSEWVPRSLDRPAEYDCLLNDDWKDEGLDFRVQHLHLCYKLDDKAHLLSPLQLESLRFLASLLKIHPDRRPSSQDVCEAKLMQENMKIWADSTSEEFRVLKGKLKESIYHKKQMPERWEMLDERVIYQ